MTSMPDADTDDTLDDDEDFGYLSLSDIENQPIYRQWRTERWLMEILLWPAKAPKPHPVDRLAWMAGNHARLATALDALEHDGLIRRDGRTVSATRAAISFWRLEPQTGPLP
jgi:hypothetical protein